MGEQAVWRYELETWVGSAFWSARPSKQAEREGPAAANATISGTDAINFLQWSHSSPCMGEGIVWDTGHAMKPP